MRTTETPAAEVPVIIPAYRPNEQLVSLVWEYEQQFRRIERPGQVRVLRHAVNLGKGAALRTAMNHVLVRLPGCCGVVTADADGQHHPKDILRVAERLRQNPEALVMGAREFGPQVPWKSQLGNRASRVLMRMPTGRRLSDTQTGLRGIPARLVPHLSRLPSSGYEFELDMLLARKYQSYRIVEEPIQTIYLNGNRSSHFNSVLDSVRIYILLFRFSILSFCTAVMDNIVFGVAHASGASIAESQVAAFSFSAARSRHAAKICVASALHAAAFPTG